MTKTKNSIIPGIIVGVLTWQEEKEQEKKRRDLFEATGTTSTHLLDLLAFF